ncbi:hypothetical protein ACJMK2_013780 [Sinanodonta woodiana]|uniref:Peptidase S1 domain-containing protein n=1 Tax=Sinanodonta woodiana TaxID=1069815 RepID=A0ABD3UYD9_SINWO
MVPSKSTIINAIKEQGYNKGIQCLLRGMANILRKQIPDAIRVWSGYRTQDIHAPVFVVMLRKKTIIPEKKILSELYDDYEIVFRNEHTPNEEEVRISEQSKVNANTKDVALILDCIAKNTERLMNEHSNLSIIAASTVKAIGFNGCVSKLKLIESRCVVLYVPLKGIIPVGEKEFPKDIDGINTDVREGEFICHGQNEENTWHPKLPMGCCISTKAGQSGTLGGFVDLPGGKTGCITAAHVVLSKTESKNYLKSKKKKKDRYNASLAQGETIIDIYQPTCKMDAFGRVSKIAYEEGNILEPSIDAALIEITDHQRTPHTGMFPSGNYPVIGFTEENPMIYNRGKTRYHSNISRGSRVVKYGYSTNITHGKLEWNGSSVRNLNTGGQSWHRLKAGNIPYPKFFNQMVVKSSDKINFSAPGDSGALVFLYHRSSRDLEAIGLLIGSSTHKSPAQMHIVTPIQAVFQKLKLDNVTFKCFPDISQEEQNLAMNELIYSRQRPEIQHEISNTRINELKEEIKEELKEALTKEMKETTKLEMNAMQEVMKETTKSVINAIKEEIRESVKEQINTGICSLEQTIIRLLPRPGGDAGNG